MSVMRLRLFGPMRLELPTAAQAAVRTATSGPAVQARTPRRPDAAAGTTPVPWQRPAALLAWLGCADDWVPREQLATWLRPDADPDTARAYLRRLLHRVRALYPAADAALQVEALRVRWAGACDVREFRAACAAQDWEQALALHMQPLLADAPALGEAAIDDWLEDERLALRRRWRTALGAALQTRGDAGDTAGVLALMQRLVDDDPLDEEGVQWVLTRAALPGADEAQRRVALQAFDALQRRMALEMALKPLPTTEALADTLRQRRDAALQAALRPAQAAASALVQHPTRRHADSSAAAPSPAPTVLAPPPVDAGPLLGRADDLAQLRRLLTRPGPRWITLLGPGGMGKTRLAAALARAESGRWRDGAWWIALATVDTATGLHDRLAEALGLPPGEGRTGQRLAAALAEREALLVLDNVEQLQPHAQTLQALVDAAPAVQWLATSREALGLAAEHRLVLEGLGTEGDQAPAQALLAQHAARHAAPLDLADPATAEAAHRLLHAVRGLPLAIELAAAWLPVMTLPELATTAADDLGALDPVQGSGAAGQRSLRAVFRASWQRLPAALQAPLAALTLMHAPFDRAAAQAVARCDAGALLQLAGKSLLQREAAGRFSLHPLVRQFAAEAAAACPAQAEALARARQRHAAHYLGRLVECPTLRPGHGDPAVVAALLPLGPDIAAAWRHAASVGDIDALARAQAQLEGLLALAGRLDEALALAEAAREQLPAGAPLRLVLDGWRLASLISLDRMAEGAALAHALLSPARDAALPPATRCTVAAAMTRLAYLRGDRDAALEAARQAVAAAEAARAAECSAGVQAPPVALMRSLQNLASVHWSRGDLDASEQAWTHLHALALAHESPRQRARALRGLGVILQQRGALDQALDALARAAAGFEGTGDRAELSQVQRSVSFVLRDLKRHDEQLEQARAAVASGAPLGLPTLQGANLFALGLACEDLGDTVEAGGVYRRCLLLAQRHRMTPLALRCLFALASLRAPVARAEALAWLHFARAHPALHTTDREEIDQRLAALAPDAGEQTAARSRAAGMSLEALVPQLLR